MSGCVNLISKGYLDRENKINITKCNTFLKLLNYH